MAFGFVISKFNLFIHLHIGHVTTTKHPFSETYLGLAAVSTGILVAAVATFHFRIVRNHVYRNEVLPASKLPLMMGGVIVLLGLMVFIYLLGVK